MDKQPMQADGVAPGPDGVDQPEAGGRTGGGESGGGAYKTNSVPGGKDHGHGGQSNIGYTGTGDVEDGGDNPNAVTKGD